MRPPDPDDRKAHVQMMATPDLWPHSSAVAAVLPLIRRHDPAPADLGLLVNRDRVPRTAVLHINILDDRLAPILRHGEIPDSVHVESYDSFEAIYDAGWIVD